MNAERRSDTYEGNERLRVVGNNVLVRVAPQRTKTGGGIVIPDNVVGTLYAVGEVVAIGYLTGDRIFEHRKIPGLRIGDHVQFVRFLEKSGANPQIKVLADEDLLCLRPADILLVMDEGDVNRVG